MTKLTVFLSHGEKAAPLCGPFGRFPWIISAVTRVKRGARRQIWPRGKLKTILTKFARSNSLTQRDIFV